MSEQNGPTIFDKIIAGEIPGYIVWQDEKYAAFLTPFANTLGMTIVVPKQNPGTYVFSLDDEAIAGLMSAAKKVAELLEHAFNVERVALVFEGEAVPHVHAKLYPMHNLQADRSALPEQTVFFPSYPGYIATFNGPEMPADELKKVQAQIQAANKISPESPEAHEN